MIKELVDLETAIKTKLSADVNKLIPCDACAGCKFFMVGKKDCCLVVELRRICNG